MLMLRLYRCDPRPRLGESTSRLLPHQALLDACTDLFVAQRLAALDLCQRFVDVAQELVVVVDQPLDRFLRRRLRTSAALVSQARELGLQLASRVSPVERVHRTAEPVQGSEFAIAACPYGCHGREQSVNNFLPNTGQQQASIGGQTHEEPTRNHACINLLTGGLLVRVQPEEPTATGG
jgi:hypothetical protein